MDKVHPAIVALAQVVTFYYILSIVALVAKLYLDVRNYYQMKGKIDGLVATLLDKDDLK